MSGHLYFSKKEAQQLLDGFEIVDMQVDHIFPYYIPDYRQYKYTSLVFARWMPQHSLSLAGAALLVGICVLQHGYPHRKVLWASRHHSAMRRT